MEKNHVAQEAVTYLSFQWWKTAAKGNIWSVLSDAKTSTLNEQMDSKAVHMPYVFPLFSQCCWNFLITLFLCNDSIQLENEHHQLFILDQAANICFLLVYG